MKTSVGILVSLFCASLAAAHSPYLLPNHFDVTKRDHVSVQASLTEDFFIPDVVMKADDYHAVIPDGTRVSIVPVYTKDLAVLDVSTAANGTYRLSTGIRAGRTAKAALLPGGEWKFLREGDAMPAGGKVHDVTSVTRAEAYVSRGTPTETALAPGNKGLEFQMITHPNRLLAGASASIRVLFDGKPLPSQIISLQKASFAQGAATAPTEISSAADGTATLTFAAPGLYHLMTRHRFVLPGDGKAESHTYALTLEVSE